MTFHVFFIAALQGHRVHGAGFLQALHLQEGKEILAFFLRLLQGLRAAHLPPEIGIKDHGAHDHRAGEQSLVGRAGQLAHDAAAAGGLAGNGHPARIPAESRDIALHPFQARLLVQVAEVGRSVRLFPADLRVGQEAQGADPVIDGDHHDAPAGNPLPVKFHFRGITALEAAAEEPDQNGHLLVRLLRLCPDVQVKAVLAHGDFRIHMPLPAVDVVSQARNPLHGNGRKTGAVPHARPAFTGLGRPPAVLTHRRRGKGNPLEGRDPRIRRFNTPNNAVLGSHLTQHKHTSGMN